MEDDFLSAITNTEQPEWECRPAEPNEHCPGYSVITSVCIKCGSNEYAVPCGECSGGADTNGDYCNSCDGDCFFWHCPVCDA